MMTWFSLAVLTVAASGESREEVAEPIGIESVLISVIEQVAVPARAPGALVDVSACEGQRVKLGDTLARIDDTEASLARDQARLELETVRRQAESDLKVRLAKKPHEIATADLKRATNSSERFRKSVTAAQIDQLRMAVEQAALNVEQAEFDLEMARQTLMIREYELKRAEHELQRRSIVAPISGVVVEVNKQRGEWVEPGDPVVRVLRIDRLRAEGFLLASELPGNLVGCRARVTVSLAEGRVEDFSGRVVFVSPEVDPVNGQLRIRADIENRDLLLRPGLQASMTIIP